MTDNPEAFVALTTARDELRSIISDDIEAFAIALHNVRLARSASEHADNAEDTLHYCRVALDQLNDIEKQNTAPYRSLPKLKAECLETTRSEIERAIKDIGAR